MWLDGAELGEASAALGALFAQRSELALHASLSSVGCPRCGGSLAEVCVQEVAIDWCTTCYGVWLDGGEYQAIQQAEHKPKAPPSHVKCYACGKQMTLGEAYYTDVGLVCIDCQQGAEGDKMKERGQQDAEWERQRRAAVASQQRAEVAGDPVYRALQGDIGRLRSEVRRLESSTEDRSGR